MNNQPTNPDPFDDAEYQPTARQLYPADYQESTSLRDFCRSLSAEQMAVEFFRAGMKLAEVQRRTLLSERRLGDLMLVASGNG